MRLRLRFWLLVLMMALLPLRGWVGDAMAGQMLAQKLSVVQPVSQDVTDAPIQHADCPGHTGNGEVGAQAPADQPSASAASGNDANSGDCGTCTACQVCHSAAFVSVPEATLFASTFSIAPALGNVAFTSTDPLAGFKPPRS
jgi:hypothetical protein